MDIKLLQPSSKKIKTESFLGQKPEEGKKRGGVYVTKKQLRTIQSKVIRIEKILGKENSMLKKQLETTRKRTQNKKRKAKEDKFETKPSAVKEAKKDGPLPKIGFFERVKNFIGKVILGFLAMKLLPFLPALLDFIPKLQGIVDWVADFGIGLLDALGGFLEGAYTLRDKTLEFIEDIGGEGAVNAFLKFEKAIEATLTALIAIGGIMAIAAGGGKGGGKGGKGGLRKGFDKAGRKASPSAMKRYYKRFGRDKFIERFGTKNLDLVPKSLRRSAVTKIARRGVTGILGRGGAKTALKGLKAMKGVISPIVKKIPFIGALIDFALNVFVFKEPIGKAAFKAIGAGLGAWMGGVIGTLIPVPFVGTAIGSFVGGMGGDAVGGMIYDMIFGSKKDTEPGKEGKDGENQDQPSTNAGSSGQSTPQTSANLSQVQGAPLGMSQKQAFATVYELAKKHQAKFPEIVAAQAMHETGYLSESLSSVFNSTGRTNAFGQTGDRGHGTIPRAGSATGWTVYPSLDEAVKDNIALWHRTSNHSGNYEAFDRPIDGIASVAPVYSPNADPANIRLGYTVDAYSSAMVKIMKSMGFDPYKANAKVDLSSDAKLQAVAPIVSSTDSSRPSGDLSGSYDGPVGAGSEAAKKLLEDFPQIKTRAHDGQIFASGLGFYLKKVGAGRGKGIGDYGDPQAGRTEQMEHPDHGGIVASHKGAGHSLGVALDLGANSATSGSYTQDQKNLWPHISKFLHKYGLHKEPYVPQVIHGPGESFSPKAGSSFADGAHHNHFHVEFQRAHAGKRTGGMGAGRINGDEFLTNVRNTERILDADTSRALGDTLVQRLDDASTSGGVQKVLAQALGISDRASYEQTGTGTVVINRTIMPVNNSTSYGSSQNISSSVGGGEDFGEILAAGQ